MPITEADKIRELAAAREERKNLHDVIIKLNVLWGLMQNDHVPPGMLDVLMGTASVAGLEQPREKNPNEQDARGTIHSATISGLGPGPASPYPAKRKRQPSNTASPAPQPDEYRQGHAHRALGPASRTSSPYPGASTGMARQNTAKERREAIADQLPLKHGREIAVKDKSIGEGGGANEGWIKAMILRHLPTKGNENRYEVEDADEEKRYVGVTDIEKI